MDHGGIKKTTPLRLIRELICLRTLVMHWTELAIGFGGTELEDMHRYGLFNCRGIDSYLE